MTRDSDCAFFDRMTQLSMTTASSIDEPSIVVKSAKNIAYFHYNLSLGGELCRRYGELLAQL
jgi:hypothetical protein